MEKATPEGQKAAKEHFNNLLGSLGKHFVQLSEFQARNQELYGSTSQESQK